MAFDGNGTFARNNGTNSGDTTWADDDAAGIDITTTNHDTHDQDIADGLSNCICRDGQSTISANIPFNNKKITGLATGTARTDAANIGNVQDNAINWGGTSGGSANAHTITLSPVVTTYVAGQMFGFIPGDTNTSTTTLNVNGVGAVAIVNQDGSNLRAGQLFTSGICVVQYNGTVFKLVSSNPPQVTTWSPTLGTATGSTSSPTITVADYKVLDTYLCWFSISAACALASGPSAYLSFTLPVTPTFAAGVSIGGRLRANSGTYYTGTCEIGSTGTALVYPFDYGTWANTTSTNKHEFSFSGVYRIQ